MTPPSMDAGSRLTQMLRSRIEGEVIGADDPAYDDARRLYFSGFDRRPAAVVRPASAAEVAKVVTLVSDHGTELTVRGGGHSVAGYGVVDDAVVLDLSALRSLEIDPVARTAWAGGGLTAGEYTAAAAEHGLATGFGDAPSVGIGGITLGGGLGFLHRALGLTIDSLLAAEVVTADGRLLQVDEEEHPELFWALRGGGGNFGVVTRLKLRLHPVDAVVGGMLLLPATPAVVAGFLEAAQSASDRLSGLINVAMAPPAPFIPAEHHGKPVIMALLVNIGSAEDGERALAPFRALATPIADHLRAMRYGAIYEAGEAPTPAFVSVRSFFMDSVDAAAAETILSRLHVSTAPMSAVQFRVLGGAVAAVPASATAFAHRDRGMMVTAATMYGDASQKAAHTKWVNDVAAELGGDSPGAYVGFLEGDGAAVRQAYPAATYERLAAVKARYDPGNVFRYNVNVEPAETGAAP